MALPIHTTSKQTPLNLVSSSYLEREVDTFTFKKKSTILENFAEADSDFDFA